LEKDPADRYGSEEALAQDLERWLRCEPVWARPTGRWETARKWVRRKPAIATLIASVALLVITVAIGSVVFAWNLAEEEKRRDVVLGILRAELKRDLDELWEHPNTPSVTITSEKRSVLIGDTQGRPAVHPGVEHRLSFGVYTFETPSEMAKNFAPLLGSFEESVADRLRRPLRIDYVIYRSYTNGHEGLVSGEVDFMRMGPASYVLLKGKRTGISLIAAQENLLQGGIFTAVNSGIENLSQLKGKPFAFGDAESTFGTHLAKLALLRAGIHAADLSTNSHHFSSHKSVVEAVGSGAYAAGAANTIFLGPNFKLLHTFTNVQVRMPFVARSGIDPRVAVAIKDALLAEHTPFVLTNIEPKLTGFREVSDLEYDGLRKEIKHAMQFGEPNN
jgi:ABC-type phosphate/phosphonate transport system substrate-binding protein